MSDVGTAVSGSKNAVENNFLGSSEYQEKTGLEYKEKKGLLSDAEQKRLIELRIKDGESTDSLIAACVNVSSDACKNERQKAYDDMATYQNLTYQNPKEHQAGYQEINSLLQGTSPESDLMRQIYDGYKNGYIGLGYSEEDAGVMAGRTMSLQMIANGVTGTISLPALNKIFSGSKLVNAGKGTSVTKPSVNVVPPKTMSDLNSDLISKGFELKSTSGGGYITYKHADGRMVTIKPTGEVIPTKPKIAENGKKYNERTDYDFNRLEDQSHSTGHFINRDK